MFLGIKVKLMVQERLRLKMAIGFNNMKFTDNLANSSLSERDSEPWARGALECLEGRNLKQEHNQLFQGILL